MNYSPEVFARLSDIEVVRHAVPFNEHKISDLGEIICQYQLADTLGVSLLHRHFDLAEDERLVTDYKDSSWSARPAIADDERVKPFIWKLDWSEQTNSWEWVPLEFFWNTAQLAEEAKQSDMVAHHVDFLRSMAARVVELEVADIFGISLLMEGKSEDGHIYFERNDKQARTMTAALVPEADITGPGGITLWNFKDMARSAGDRGRVARSCAHGNSKHCCGK